MNFRWGKILLINLGKLEELKEIFDIFSIIKM